MEKKWNAIQFCVILALTLASTNCLCSFAEGYIAGKEIQIIKGLGGDSPVLEKTESEHYSDGQSNAAVAGLLIYVLVAIRKNGTLGPILPSDVKTT